MMKPLELSATTITNLARYNDVYKPVLESWTFNYVLDPDESVEGDEERITITKNEEGYYTISTDKFSFETVEDFQALLEGKVVLK